MPCSEHGSDRQKIAVLGVRGVHDDWLQFVKFASIA